MAEAVEAARTQQAAPEGLPAPQEETPADDVPRLKSGVDAREASRLGHAAQASLRRSREAAQPGDVIRHLRVPVNVAATVRRLAAEAQRGSTHASRELRAWMAELEADIPVSTSELDAKTRQRLLTRLLSELEAEDDPQPSPGVAAPQNAP